MNVDRVELTVWCREREELDDDYTRQLVERLSAIGGAAEPGLVRQWLRVREESRERSASPATTASVG
jgi:hypothetical protein